MEKKNSERERKKTTSEIDKTQKKLLDSKTSIKKTSTGTSKTQLFDSSTNNVDKTSINKKSTSQKEKTTTDLQKKEKVSKSIIQNGSKTRLDKDKDKDVSKTKVEGKKIDTSKIKNVQADKKYAKVPINSKENSFVDQVPYNATKTKLVKPKVDDKTGLDKKKRIVADRLKNGDAKVSSSKKKDRVMATHTNVTVQSPVHSKQNSLVEDLSQNYNEVSSMYKSTPEAFGDNIKVSSKTKSRPEDLGDNIKVSSKTKSIPEAFGDNIKVSSKSKSSSDNTEVPSSSKPTPESLRTNTEESSISAPKKLKREKTLILETNEIKILKNISYTIDLDNPDAEISLTNYPNDDENYDYEDDFESYESDFESCSSSSPENQEEDTSGSDQEEDNENLSSNNDLDSSKDMAANKDGTFKDSGASKVFTQDEERKLDSGNFDLPSKPTLSSPPTLTDINETDNVVDEGFAEQSNPKSDLLTEESSLGDDIVVHYVEMQPLTYKEFMDNSLHQESLQIQENQDMNIDDLYPIPRYITETDNALNRDFPVDFPKLNTFLRKAAKEVLSCLEEQLQPKLKHNKENLDFSEGYYKMHQDLFKGIPASCLCFQNNKKFLAAAFSEVNLKNERRNALDLGSGDDIDIRRTKSDSYICIWHIQDISSPKYILNSKSAINCCSFIDNYVLVAGCNDGSLLCWDLDENTSKFDETFNRNIKLPSQVIMEENSERGSITQITFMSDTEYDINTQVCVLYKYGYISIWTIVKNQQTTLNQLNLSKDSSGLSLQSNVRLFNSHTLKIKPLKSNKLEQLLENQEPLFNDTNKKDFNNMLNDSNMDLEYCNMCLDATDPRLVYVFAKHSQYVVACNVSWDDRFQYYSFDNDTPLHLCSNPNKQPWFSLLCTENIFIFKKFHPKPIIKITMSTNLHQSRPKPNECYIKSSPSHPGLLFSIKNTHLWILDVVKQEIVCEGDFKEKIKDVEMCRRMDRDYLIISLKNRIEVHKISKKYRLNTSDDIIKYQEELSDFIKLF